MVFCSCRRRSCTYCCCRCHSVVLVEVSTLRMACPSVIAPNLDNMAVALGTAHLSLQVLVNQGQVRLIAVGVVRGWGVGWQQGGHGWAAAT